MHLDDRGKPLPSVERLHIADQLTDDDQSRNRWWLKPLAIGRPVCIGIMLIFAAYKFSQNPGQFLHMSTAQAVMLGCAVFFGVIGPPVFRHLARGKEPALPPRLPRLNAWPAAHRRCGACGYDLRQFEPAPDGCAVCPECGAAWHRDRWTLADRDVLDSSSLLAAWSETESAFSFSSDDRGVPLDGSILAGSTFSLTHWLNKPRLPQTVQRAALNANRRFAKRRMLVAGSIIAALWLTAQVVIALVRDPDPRDDITVAAFVAIITGLIALTLLWAFARMGNSSRRHRAMILSLHRCPNCAGELPAAPIAFDGCVACLKCRRAWKVSPEHTMPRDMLPR